MNRGSFFQQFANSEDNDNDEDVALNDIGAAVEDREKWEIEELPSKKRAREELGDPDERHKCFGCVYEMSADGTQIPSQAYRELVMLASKCMGQMSLEALCTEMARVYEKFRSQINNRLRHEQGHPLPPWSAASILDHLKNHNIDPEVKTLINLIETGEMIELAKEGIIEVSDKTGKRRINKDALANYERLVKLWYYIASRPLDKLFAYRKGGHVDIEAVNQPFVAKHQKTIVDYYN